MWDIFFVVFLLGDGVNVFSGGRITFWTLQRVPIYSLLLFVSDFCFRWIGLLCSSEREGKRGMSPDRDPHCSDNVIVVRAVMSPDQDPQLFHIIALQFGQPNCRESTSVLGWYLSVIFYKTILPLNWNSCSLYLSKAIPTFQQTPCGDWGACFPLSLNFFFFIFYFFIWRSTFTLCLFINFFLNFSTKF